MPWGKFAPGHGRNAMFASGHRLMLNLLVDIAVLLSICHQTPKEIKYSFIRWGRDKEDVKSILPLS